MVTRIVSHTDLRCIPGRMLRAGLALLFSGALLLMGAHSASAQAEEITARDHAERLSTCRQQILNLYYDPEARRLRDDPILAPEDHAITSFTKYIAYWPLAWILELECDAVATSPSAEARSAAALIKTLLEVQNTRSWNAGFYDDEAWMLVPLTRVEKFGLVPFAGDVADQITRRLTTEAYDPRPLKAAAGTSSTLPKGGVWWDYKHTQMATAANAGMARSVAFWAHNHPTHPDAASRAAIAHAAFQNWLRFMVDPATARVRDHVTSSGQIVDWEYSYNEALMLAACLELLQADAKFPQSDISPDLLIHARRFADRLIARYTIDSPVGRILQDGDGKTCTGDCPMFRGISLRFLAQLYRIHPDPRYRDVIIASARAAYELGRDPVYGLFSADWSGRNVEADDTNITQNIAALLALQAAVSVTGADEGAKRDTLN